MRLHDGTAHGNLQNDRTLYELLVSARGAGVGSIVNQGTRVRGGSKTLVGLQSLSLVVPL